MAIDPERVKEIFLEAAEREDEAARTAYLDGVCGSDVGLRARVEALLRNHDPEGSFLGTPMAVVPEPDQAAPRPIAADANPAIASGGEPSASQAGSTARNAVPAGHGSTATGIEDEPLTFLAPPQRPGSLGRIGHYEVLQVLGRGGFGIVFRAFDEMLQRVVALKVMAPQLAATSPARKRFLREARSSAQVRHENVVQVYEIAEQPLPYLVMEFIPGETLQQKLDRVGPLDVSEVLQIARQIAEGLAAAHATDLIHRDIKPGNVLLEGGHHKVKITDFGLARAADDASISQSGIIAGTPMYMAPEQAKGDKLDQRADLFSLGSVLYQMVAGRPPFRANTAVAVLKRIAEDKPRAIREIIPEAPQWLCDIIAKLHEKNPDDRYQSAREVADVLADCEAQLKVNARLKDYSRIPRIRARPTGRGKWVAAAAAVLLPVIALVVTEFAGVTHLFQGRPATSDADGAGSDVQAKAPPLAIAPFDAAQAHAHQETWAEYLGVPVEFTNTLGMKFVLIPPGEFTMGSSPEEASSVISQIPEWAREWVRSETPAQKVQIPQPFYLGTTEVTVGQFERFVAATHYKTQAETNGKGGTRWTGRKNETKPEFTWRHKDFTRSSLHPVGQLCPADAIAFCRWVQGVDGRSHRLPDEEQWEYACRAGTVTPWSFGTDAAVLKLHGLSQWNLNFTGAAVAQKPPNPFGLFDVHGNFEEMCRCKDGSYVVRGGSTGHDRWLTRSAIRMSVGFQDPEGVHGFRVAIVGNLKQEPPPPPAAFTDADVKRIAALPAAEQVEEVRQELMRRNPRFDGKVEHKIEDEVVTEFKIVTDNVTDIAPIRVFNALRVLACSATWNNGQLADLTPLEGVNLSGLRHLELWNTKVTDAGMAYFKDCNDLIYLELPFTQVGDAGLTHFKDCKALSHLDLGGTKVGDAETAAIKNFKALTHLYLGQTKVSDAYLAHLKGIPLKVLWIYYTDITDLTPLQGMPLEDVRLTPKNITKGLDILRGMKSLKTIGIEFNQSWPAAEFWERYDKGKFKE
jgi:serine/threonine protein kinase